MIKKLLATTVLVAAFVAAPANAATTLVNFSGTLAGLGAYSADVTLDVVDGQAVSGTGTIDLFGAVRDLGLVTTGTPGNNDQSAAYPGFPVGFRSNGGDDLLGADQAFPLTTQGGLLFAIGTTTPMPGQNALINFFNDNGTLTSVVFGFVDDFRAYNNLGTLNVTTRAAVDPSTPAVPEPATWGMMLVGFAAIGAMARYRRRTSSVTYA